MSVDGPKTQKTAIVWIPPREAWGPIQRIRRRHDRHIRRWMPHVTLIYPFRPRRAFDTLTPRLCEACAAIPPVCGSQASLASTTFVSVVPSRNRDKGPCFHRPIQTPGGPRRMGCLPDGPFDLPEAR